MKRLSKLFALAVLVLLCFRALPIGAEETPVAPVVVTIKEKDTAASFRIGEFTFADKENKKIYGDAGMDFSLDFTLDTKNPKVACRIAIDGVSSSSNFKSGSDLYQSDLSAFGFSAAFLYQSDRKQDLRFYGGAGVGFYFLTETGTATVGGAYKIIDGAGSGTGTNVMGGVEYTLRNGFALGLEYAYRILNAGMNTTNTPSASKDFSGQSLLLTFNFVF